MLDLAKVTRIHSAALEEAHRASATPGALASAIQEIMDDFTIATKDRLYTLDNSRATLKNLMVESPISKQPLAQLEGWLSIIVPALTELGNGSLRNVNQMRQSIQKIDDSLQEDTELNRVALSTLDLAFDQVGDLAAKARSRYAAWRELHESIQDAIRKCIACPQPESQDSPTANRPFDQKLQQLDHETCIVLQEVTHSEPLGATASTLERYLKEHHQPILAQLESHLQKLESLGLVAKTDDNTWRATWDGHGVANWWQQSNWYDPPHIPPQPRPDENGQTSATKPCDEYRALYTCPGYCWCGHIRSSHPSEAVRAAELLLESQ